MSRLPRPSAARPLCRSISHRGPLKCCTRFAIFFVLLSTFSACSPTSPTLERVSQPSASPEQYEFEVVTIEQQAREEVSAAPLEFYLPSSQQSGAEGKTVLFFQQFLNEPRPARVGLSPRGVRFTHSSSATYGRYHYSVDFVPSGGRIAVFVSCIPRDVSGSMRAAEMNAKNLSRFIREGTLELSLLSR